MRIEKNVPIPPPGPKYPWHKLAVGDSFLVDEKPSRVMSAANFRAKNHGEKYTCRTVDGGVRVWRKA